MNSENRIRELVQAYLVDDHQVETVRFIDELLLLAAEQEEIRCSLVGESALRFESSEHHSTEVKVGRAKTKLRMLCARLAVLCNESGGSEVSLYGGEGIVKKGVPRLSSVAASAGNPVPVDFMPPEAGTTTTIEERVRFMNTPSEQWFLITAH